MASSAPLVVVGLDSADLALVDRWCDSGDLPVLASVRRRGLSGVLRSPPGLGDDATWASFSTSVSPARHGRWHVTSLRDGSYRSDWFGDGPLGHESFWDALSRAGKRVAIIDVPKTPLSSALHGIQLADWRVHGRDGVTRSVPPELATELTARFGEDPTDRPGTADWLCRLEAIVPGERAELGQRLLGSVEQKAAFCTDLLDAGPWDLFLVVFKEAHCIAHQAWGFQDAPGHADPVRAVYRALDAAVGRLLERAGPDATVLVFSDLGMDRNVTGEHLLDEVLLRLERRHVASRGGVRSAAARLARTLGRFPGNRVPDARAARRAFQLDHNEISGAVRVNLRGREPAGRVRPGRDFEALCDQLTTELLALVDPDTGAPLVREVVRTDRLWAGECRHRLPDLFAVWNRDAPIHGAASPSIGVVRATAPAYRPGNHRPDGFVLAAGPGIAFDTQIHAASIMDIGPSVAALLGVALPDVDGAPIPAICGS